MATPLERAAAARLAMPSSSPRQQQGSAAEKKAGRTTQLGSKWTENNGNERVEVSVRDTGDEKAAKYLEVLQKGAAGVKGILASTDREGEPLLPYTHQRKAVKLCAERDREFILLAHDAGTGKTATFFQLFAAIEILVSGGARCIITAPPATLCQWQDTAHTWLKLANKADVIVCTNREKDITEAMLKRVRVLVITKHLLARLYKKNWEYVSDFEKNERGHWIGGVRRREAVALHPIWKEKWDVSCYDEAHLLRNEHTEWNRSHSQLSKGIMENGRRIGGSNKRVALTATPVFNAPSDMVGLCKALHTTEEFRDKHKWSDPQGRRINKDTIKRFQYHADRVKDSILALPEIKQEVTTFQPGLTPEEVEIYNQHLDGATRIRMSMESSNKVTSAELQKLMNELQRMQQMLVSPKLASMGAEYFEKHPDEVQAAAARSTGALEALRSCIRSKRQDGHARIIVACNHVMLMRVAVAYLRRTEPDIGSLMMYDGSLTQKQRQAQHQNFFAAEKAILFLSIGAGGTGLHLVPARADTPCSGFCRTMIFWGSRPWSPQQVLQAMKRIHRLGQKYPVKIQHIIAEGSVDWAIGRVHKDKEALASAVVDDDWSNCNDDGEWKLNRRVVDNCFRMLPDGTFPDAASHKLPMHPVAAASGGGSGAAGGPMAIAHQVAVRAAMAQQPLTSPYFRQPLVAAAQSAETKVKASPPRPEMVRISMSEGREMTVPLAHAEQLGYTAPSDWNPHSSLPPRAVRLVAPSTPAVKRPLSHSHEATSSKAPRPAYAAAQICTSAPPGGSSASSQSY